MLARIISEQLQYGLPVVGVLSDGRSVSHYDLLPQDVLTNEGWKETIENIPELSKDEYPVIDSFVDDGSNIIINYRAETI